MVCYGFTEIRAAEFSDLEVAPKAGTPARAGRRNFRVGASINSRQKNTTGALELNPPSLKTRNFFLRRELKKIKTRTDFREIFGKNKNPRAQRAKNFGVFQKLPN